MRAMYSPRAARSPMFRAIGVLRAGLSRIFTRGSVAASSRSFPTVPSCDRPSMNRNSTSPSSSCASIARAAPSMWASSFRTGVRTLTSTPSGSEEPRGLPVSGQLGLAEDEVLGGQLVLALALDQRGEGLHQHQQV